MTESENLAHAMGMRAYLAGKERLSPWDVSHSTEFDILLCRAWFRGYDDAKRAEPQERELPT
jgi:hypothetical protein